MPLSHVTKVFAAKDCKVYPLLTDPAGGTPTYGTGIDVPGIKTVGISGDINIAELRGDNQRMDQQATIGGIDVSVEYAKLSLDLLAAWFENTVVDSGVAPNQTSVWELAGTSRIGYIGLSAVAVGADTIGGDVHFMLPKLMLSSFPEMGLEEEDYRSHSVEFGSMPLLSTGRWIAVGLNETAAVLSAPAGV